MRRTRTKFERELRQRRNSVERTVKQNRRRVEREVRSVRKDLEKQSEPLTSRVEKLVSDAYGPDPDRLVAQASPARRPGERRAGQVRRPHNLAGE